MHLGLVNRHKGKKKTELGAASQDKKLYTLTKYESYPPMKKNPKLQHGRWHKQNKKIIKYETIK